MSKYRINITAALSAIALCAAPSLTAQTTTQSETQRQKPSTSSSSSTGSSSTSTTQSPTYSSPSSSSGRETSSGAATSTRGAQSTTRSTTAAAGQTSAASMMADVKVKRASDDADESSVADLKGKKLLGSGGDELGKIHDFIIDGSSGKISHVVISTGGLLGVGDKLRLIEPTSVKPSADEDFSSDMSQSEFKALPTISESDLDAGRIDAITAQAQPQQRSSSTSSDVASSRPSASSSSTGNLIRASRLEDKTVRADDREVGEIEEIVIDLQAGKAMALIDANQDFAGESGKYLVPFAKLEVSSQEADTIGSSLMRSDFPSQDVSSTTAATSYSVTPSASSTETSSSRVAGATSTTPSSTASGTTPSTSTGDTSLSSTAGARSSDTTTSGSTSGVYSSSSTPSSSTTRRDTSSPATSSSRTDSASSVASSTSPSTSTTDTSTTSDPTRSSSTSDEQLTPTGTTSAYQSPASNATAMAIRQALDKDATLAKEDVQVTTKIVLRGSVENEEAKDRIEKLAKKAAQNAEIDNQIKVRKD